MSSFFNCNTTNPPFVLPTSANPAFRKQRPGSRFFFTFPASTNVIIPPAGASPYRHLVAATASVINALDNTVPSFRNALQFQASFHSCFTYSGYCQLVTQNASSPSVTKTKARPGGAK